MLDKKYIIKLLESRGGDQRKLLDMAQSKKEKVFGRKIHFRGIIEFSNICGNNCYYCGIRADNKKVNRYRMSIPEIEKSLDFIAKAGYGSVVFQSGELQTESWRKYLLDIVRLTKKRYPKLGITVSCGEQSFEFYKKLKSTGADRYLLRIETSNKNLYKKLHPKKMSLDNRMKCLKWLKKLGFQVGTGIMIGLPEQTTSDLADDLIFFKKNKFDMYGLGPYVIHEDTPIATPDVKKHWNKNKNSIFNMTLNFLAVLRIMLPTVNIAAATALDVFDPLGRIKALEKSANIIMPVVTPKKYRSDYILYQGKPCIDEDAENCFHCLTGKIKMIGLQPIFGEQGNSPFYQKRTHGKKK